MDLFPPHNEICSRLVYALTNSKNEKQGTCKILSFPNPKERMTAPPDGNHIGLPDKGFLNALILPFFILKYAVQRKSIVHFFMPTKYPYYIYMLLFFCKVFRIPTIYTLLKNNINQILCSRHAKVIVTQTGLTFQNAKTLLPNHDNIHLIHCGTSKFKKSEVNRKRDEILFIGIPWKQEDFSRRGVYLLFDTIDHMDKIGSQIHFTVLNRALSNSSIIDEMASRFTKSRITVKHGSVSDIENYYSSNSLFLCLHLDDLCPDPPLSVIEACSCGCPIVTTKHNTISDIILREQAGVVVDENPISIAEGIETVCKRMSTYSENALRTAQTYFSEKHFCHSYFKLYREL